MLRIRTCGADSWTTCKFNQRQTNTLTSTDTRKYRFGTFLSWTEIMLAYLLNNKSTLHQISFQSRVVAHARERCKSNSRHHVISTRSRGSRVRVARRGEARRASGSVWRNVVQHDCVFTPAPPIAVFACVAIRLLPRVLVRRVRVTSRKQEPSTERHVISPVNSHGKIWVAAWNYTIGKMSVSEAGFQFSATIRTYTSQHTLNGIWLIEKSWFYSIASSSNIKITFLLKM